MELVLDLNLVGDVDIALCTRGWQASKTEGPRMRVNETKKIDNPGDARRIETVII